MIQTTMVSKAKGRANSIRRGRKTGFTRVRLQRRRGGDRCEGDKLEEKKTEMQRGEGKNKNKKAGKQNARCGRMRPDGVT